MSDVNIRKIHNTLSPKGNEFSLFIFFQRYSGKILIWQSSKIGFESNFTKKDQKRAIPKKSRFLSVFLATLM